MTIAITGVGIVSAVGRGVPATLDALRTGRSGLGPLTLFDSPRCGHLPIAEVDGVEGAPRAQVLASLALQQLDPPGDAGLAIGTTVGGMPESEVAAAQLIAGEPFDEGVWGRHECGYLTHALAREHGLTGPTTTLCTACSSSAEAIAIAVDMIRNGEADRMVAGGVDALCRLTLNGFASLLIVDEEGCRPFDRERGGMSLGEGAAFLLLERLDETDRKPLAILAGCGNSCDAWHVTAPDPEGRGAERALRAALDESGLAPDAIDYITAHGTGTRDNDRAEGRAMNRLFDRAPPPFSSTKRLFGHTLGAAGAIEAVVSVLAISEGVLPGNPGFATPDPECEVVPVQQTVDKKPRVVLSSSFGFGGNNTVLCLTCPPDFS